MAHDFHSTVYMNQKIKNVDTEIFCHEPFKQEPSPAYILDKVVIYEFYKIINLYKSTAKNTSNGILKFQALSSHITRWLLK